MGDNEAAVESALNLLYDCPADLAEFCAAEAAGLTADARVRLLVAIRECRAQLAAIADDIEKEVLADAGEKRWTVAGVGEVEVHRRIKRTGWRHDDLIPVVVGRLIDEPGVVWDPVTGERVPPAETAAQVARGLRECIGFGPGKVTGLRARGIDPDEFCVTTPEGWSLQLPPRQL